MTTVSNLIDSTRLHLHGTHRPEFNFLSATITSTATSITVDLAPRGVATNAILGIDDELLFVKSISGQVATVARGWLGTTPAAHTVGATIEINPRFSRSAIKQALKEEIAGWPPSLHWVDTVTVSGVINDRSYDLTALGDFYDIPEVRRAAYTGSTSGTWPIVRSYEIARNMPTATFASGKALFLVNELAGSASLVVTVTKPFVTSTFENTTEIETTCKLAASMVDIPPMGAAWRLLAPREVARTAVEAQGSRNPQEVPVGSAVQTATGLKRLRDQRIIEESDRLAAKTAIRF